VAVVRHPLACPARRAGIRRPLPRDRAPVRDRRQPRVPNL